MNLPPCPRHWQLCHQARKHAKLRAETDHPEAASEAAVTAVGTPEPPPASGAPPLAEAA